MTSCESRTFLGRRLALGMMASGGAALWLSGCGFRPLYGRSSASGRAEVMEVLSRIRIGAIPDRQGQRLRQILREKLASGEEGSPIALEVVLTRQVQELGVRPDSTTSRANLIFTAGVNVVENGARIYADNVQSIVSYNILDDQYGTVSSQSDAEDRALRQIGDEIKTRLGIFFDRRLSPRKG